MTDLAADPVFQLNTVLWMLQPFPGRPGAVNAVLYLHDYRVRALGPRLSADPGVEEELATAFGIRGVPQPDVLADSPAETPRLVFECKASSFGADSTTAEQARKVLARSADLGLVVGAPRGRTAPGAVVYLTRADHAEALGATLAALRGEVEEAGIACAPASVLAVSAEPGEGVVVGIASGDLPDPAGTALSGSTVVVPAAGDEEVARPLYLVPFDPSVTQEPDERDFCRRVLLERARTHVVARLGRLATPDTAVIDCVEIVHEATYGLSRYWRDTKSRNDAALEVVNFAKKALRQMKPKPVEVNHPYGEVLEVRLHNDEEREAAANGLMAAALPGDLDTLADGQQEINLYPDAEE